MFAFDTFNALTRFFDIFCCTALLYSFFLALSECIDAFHLASVFFCFLASFFARRLTPLSLLVVASHRLQFEESTGGPSRRAIAVEAVFAHPSSLYDTLLRLQKTTRIRPFQTEQQNNVCGCREATNVIHDILGHDASKIYIYDPPLNCSRIFNTTYGGNGRHRAVGPCVHQSNCCRSCEASIVHSWIQRSIRLFTCDLHS